MAVQMRLVLSAWNLRIIYMAAQLTYSDSGWVIELKIQNLSFSLILICLPVCLRIFCSVQPEKP